MNQDQETRVRAYVRLVRSAETLHAAVSRGLVLEGLTASQFSTLKALRMLGPLAQRDIAKHILKSGGNITVVVDNLERDGWVVRDRDKEDRRIVYVRLTDDGRELFDRIYPGHLERIWSVMSGLTHEECALLADLLDKLSVQDSAVDCAPATAANR